MALLNTGTAPAGWARSGAALRAMLADARAWPRPRRPTAPMPAVDRLGDLEVRLAAGPKELRRAQRVRYRVFFEHGTARPSLAAALQRRDLCPFDAICDHLVVIDHAARSRRTGRRKPRVVGTYRLLRQEVAERHGGFYSAGEFDLAPLLARHGGLRFLELGRSCVLPRYRSKRVIELLWRGISAYVRHHRVDVLLGCASFEGTEIEALAAPLAALRQLARAEPEWQAAPVPGRGSPPPEVVAGLDRRAALAALPPLIKGYLRAGARFADGAVVDRAFGTVDVLAVMPMAALDARYRDRFADR